VFIIFGLIVVLAVASDVYLSRMQSIAHYQADGSAQGRLLAWSAGIEMAIRRPLLGVGLGCFPFAFAGWGYSVPGVPMMNAHSMYFLALGELAWPGIAILLGLLWVLFRDNQSAIKSISRRQRGRARPAKAPGLYYGEPDCICGSGRISLGALLSTPLRRIGNRVCRPPDFRDGPGHRVGGACTVGTTSGTGLWAYKAWAASPATTE
jgi:hypothetical protein